MSMKLYFKNLLEIEKKSFYSNIKTTIISLLISIIFWYILVYHIVHIVEFLSLILLTTTYSSLFVNFIYKLPNSYIDEDDSMEKQQFYRILQLTIGTIGIYFIIFGILSHYYPSFEVFVCCDFMSGVHDGIISSFN